MASNRIPQYVRQVAPEDRGQQLAGLGNRANAGIGASIADFGSRLAGWAERKEDRREARREQEAERTAIVAASRSDRELDNRRLRYMLQLKDPERRKELTAVSVDPVTGDERSGYDVELDRFGDWMKSQFDELSGTMSPRAKQKFEVEYNTKQNDWSMQFVSAVDQLEIEDVTAQAQALAKEGRSADALDLADLYKDRLGPELHGKLAMQLAISGAQADLQRVAQVDGWEAARKTLQDPVWQETYGLDLKEAAGVRGALGGFVDDEQTREQRRLAAEVDQNDRTILADAWTGKEDLAGAIEMMEKGLASPSVVDQAMKISVEGPAQFDDQDAYVAAQRKLSEVRNGRAKREDTISWLKENAWRFRETTWKGLVADMEKAGDPDDPMGSPTVKLLDRMLDENFGMMGTGKEAVLAFAGRTGEAAEPAYIDAKLRWHKYVTEHPDATDEQLNTFYQGLVEPVVKARGWQRIKEWFDSRGWIGDWQDPFGFSLPVTVGRGLLDPVVGPGGKNVKEFLDRHPPHDILGVSTANRVFRRYRMPGDPEVEPATEQEFEDTVSQFAPGSDGQKAYYDKWVKKWQ